MAQREKMGRAKGGRKGHDAISTGGEDEDEDGGGDIAGHEEVYERSRNQHDKEKRGVQHTA